MVALRIIEKRKIRSYEIRSLSGYLICTKYDECGNLLDSETLYIDKSGEIDKNITTIAEYIPDEIISFEKLMKLLEGYNSVREIYREYPMTPGLSHGMYDFCSNAIQLGVNIKFPEEFYEEKNTLLFNLRTYHKGGGIYIHLSCSGVMNRRGSFIDKKYLDRCGEHMEVLFINPDDTVEETINEIIFQVSQELSNLYRDEDFGFKAKLVVDRCEVHLFKNNEIDKGAEEFIKTEINKELEKEREGE